MIDRIIDSPLPPTKAGSPPGGAADAQFSAAFPLLDCRPKAAQKLDEISQIG